MWRMMATAALAAALVGCAAAGSGGGGAPCAKCERVIDSGTKPVVAWRNARWVCRQGGMTVDCTGKKAGACSDCVVMK